MSKSGASYSRQIPMKFPTQTAEFTVTCSVQGHWRETETLDLQLELLKCWYRITWAV